MSENHVAVLKMLRDRQTVTSEDAPLAYSAAIDALREEEESMYVIDKLSRLLAEIAVIVNGPEPPLTRWSYHDLPEKVRALKCPAKHQFWGAGELGCPIDIKAGNGELHTLRCKVCGQDNPKSACTTPSPEAYRCDDPVCKCNDPDFQPAPSPEAAGVIAHASHSRLPDWRSSKATTPAPGDAAREAEVRELRTIQRREEVNFMVRIGEMQNRATAAESRLGKAEALLRQARQHLDGEHYADRPLRDRITDFFKGVEGG